MSVIRFGVVVMNDGGLVVDGLVEGVVEASVSVVVVVEDSPSSSGTVVRI